MLKKEHHYYVPKPTVPERKFSVPLIQRSQLWLSMMKEEYEKRKKASEAKPSAGVWEVVTANKDGEDQNFTIAPDDQPTMLDIMDASLK